MKEFRLEGAPVSLLVALVWMFLWTGRLDAAVNEAWVKQHYQKREVMVPMRDGIKLYTAVYEPKTVGQHPILMFRTPYGCYPYGDGFGGGLWNNLAPFSEKEYIFVFQDVRGRRMSEGEFENVRPIVPQNPCRGAEAKPYTDDVSDAYDTADWLLTHTSNNGSIGVTGNSYLGYYAITSAICGHSAIKAVCPQAPIGDWFLGDDTHHNGALMLTDAFNFLSGFDRPRKAPSQNDSPYRAYYSDDERSFFLREATVENLSGLLGDSIKFWKDFTQHPNYDKWWQERNYDHWLKRVKAAVMVVGGLYDAEDLYGTFAAYHNLTKWRKNNLYLLIGPWSHGGWWGGEANTLGGVRFSEENLGEVFRNQFYRFFNHYLLGESFEREDLTPVRMFFTGENQWRNLSQWPSKDARKVSLYLQPGGNLSFEKPNCNSSATEYISDPSNPVPYCATSTTRRKASYMIENQNFLEGRPDVLSFRTQQLQENVMFGGGLEADLWVKLSTTDADFVVKLIDEFPQEEGGMQQLVRAEVMRGRYRYSFAQPQAFVPGKWERVKFSLPDVAHSFRSGHRILVQIQSSWFPLVDRNPQRYVDIYHCKPNDFVPSRISIAHERKHPSRLQVYQLP